MTKKKVKKIVLITMNIVVIVGLGFTSGFYFVKYRNEKNNNLTTDQRIAKYEKEISKSYSLPSGEKAGFAQIDNAEQYKKNDANKDFFKDTQNGDVLLVYSKASLGILYRPSTKKIIKTGPLSIKQTITAFIVGAKTDRNTVIATLKSAFTNDISTANEVDAKTPLVAGATVIVDVTGKNADLAKRLATELKGTVGNVPEGQDRAPEGVGVAIYAAPPITGI